MDLLDWKTYRKALVPAGVGIVLTISGSFGITADMRFEEVVTLIMTSVIVYLVPNKT